MPSNTEVEESRVTKIMWKVLSAAVGAGTILVALTLWVAAVKGEAHEARCDIDDLKPRVKTLEIHDAEDRKEAEGRYKMLEEVRGDMKETRADIRKILERLPK